MPILEERLQRDINQIRSRVLEMGELAKEALSTALDSMTGMDRQMAYSVILRDRYIDELEKELDRLCQEFLVRQLPVAGHLRFIYAVIKINNELERVGDYAESVARQFLSITTGEGQPSFDRFLEIARIAIEMLDNALKSFKNQDAELAIATKNMETRVDEIRYQIHNDLVQLGEDGKLPSESLPPLLIIASRFERVADQACNICEEVIFMCTGADPKHEGREVIRMLFVDERDSCRAQMAQGIGKSLSLDRFRFNSAGISPLPIDPRTVQFMKKKNIDISTQTSKNLSDIPDIEYYQVIVALCKEAQVAFPPQPTKTVSISWEIGDPSKFDGTEEEIQTQYDKTFKYLRIQIQDLVQAIMGDKIKNSGG